MVAPTRRPAQTPAPALMWLQIQHTEIWRNMENEQGIPTTEKKKSEQQIKTKHAYLIESEPRVQRTFT